MTTKPDKPVFRRVLDCFIGHITMDDEAFLADNNQNSQFRSLIVSDSVPYGHIVSLPSRTELEEALKLVPCSDQFKEILRWASRVGASQVHFDTDGETYSQFETFEW